MQLKWAYCNQNNQHRMKDICNGEKQESLQHPEKPPDEEIQPNRNDGLCQNRGEYKTSNPTSNIKKI